MVFYKPKAKSRSQDQPVTGKTPNPQEFAVDTRRPSTKTDNRTTTKPGKAMSFLPAVPFTSGSSTLKEEKRLKIGKRQRKSPIESETPPTTSEDDCKKVRIKRLGPSLQMMQGRVSRLWRRKEKERSLESRIESSSSPLASEDECCKSNRSNNTTSQVQQEPQLSRSNNRDTNFPLTSCVRMGLFKHFRKKKVVRPYASLIPSGEDLAMRSSPDDTGSESQLHDALPVSFPSVGNMPLTPSIQSTPCSTPEDDFEESLMDVESTLGVEPSVADSSTAADSSIGVPQEPKASLPPKHKLRKSREAKHGDDSILIGMIVCFDPTAELLNMGNEPQCVGKTSLGKLQKNDDHQGHLLGDWKEEESAEELPSFSDLLGFHLDCFGPPSNINSSMEEEEQDHSFPRFHDEEEINFVFQHQSDEHEAAMDYRDSSPIETEGDEEIEIVFFPINHVYTPDDDDEVSLPSSFKESSCLDGQTNESEGSALPVEWMLPESEGNLCNKLENCGSILDPPEYEWFHPDHLDVKATNPHAPIAKFSSWPVKIHRFSVTPSTVGETLSFDVRSSSCDSSEGSEVLSDGSRPSEAVQSLLDFCHLSDDSSIGYPQAPQTYGLPAPLTRNVSTSISILARGIDF